MPMTLNLPSLRSHRRKMELKLRNAFQHMRKRCLPDAKFHDRYYDRGIHVCAEWLANPDAFYLHVGLPPTQKHQIDRIDNDRGYGPGNVRWATPQENVRNSSASYSITIDGITKPRYAWLEAAGIEESLFRWRVRHGWTAADALRAPASLQVNPFYAVAASNGISISTYKYRVRVLKWSRERASTEAVHNRGQRRAS